MGQEGQSRRPGVRRSRIPDQRRPAARASATGRDGDALAVRRTDGEDALQRRVSTDATHSVPPCSAVLDQAETAANPRQKDRRRRGRLSTRCRPAPAPPVSGEELGQAERFQKIVIAYSGGIDTHHGDLGWMPTGPYPVPGRVIATADVGQGEEHRAGGGKARRGAAPRTSIIEGSCARPSTLLSFPITVPRHPSSLRGHLTCRYRRFARTLIAARPSPHQHGGPRSSSARPRWRHGATGKGQRQVRSS